MSGRPSRGWRRVAGGAALAVTGWLAACSLGLDESLIAAGVSADDGGRDPDRDGGVVDGGGGDATPGATCDSDQQCVPSNACLTGRCDLVRHVCVYDACKRPGTCSAAACDVDAGVCGEARSYPFRAAQFPVGTGTACGSSSTARCLAAVYPFVFVATNLGPMAFLATDPAATTPRAVPITGVGFVPNTVLASGSRVYFLASGSSGNGDASRIPVAWLDVPSDPFVSQLSATTVLARVDKQLYQPRLQPRTGGTALLFDAYAFLNFPASILEPPLAEPLALTATPLSVGTRLVPQVSSGERLLFATADDAGAVRAAFVGAAGTGSPQTGAETVLSEASGPVIAQTFSPGGDGAILWEFLTVGQEGPVARGSFLVADGAASMDPSNIFDIESYGADAGAPSNPVGPAALLDADTALVTAASPTAPADATVQVAKRGVGVVKNADGSARRYTVSAGAHQIGVAASHGLGYVLVYDSSNASTVHVFDPSCDL